MISDDLRTSQLLELKILLEFDRICRKYNLEYFIHGGTLLGAVRHKGFIPWDDDIDVGMCRKDYDRFLSICLNELNPEFTLHTPESDPTRCDLFVAITLNGIYYRDVSHPDIEVQGGVWIDVFPFDYVARGKLCMYFQVLILSVLQAFCRVKWHLYSISPQSSIDKIKRAGIQFFSIFFSKKILMILKKKIIFSSAYTPSAFCAGWPFPPRPASLLDGTIMMEFETYQFPAPLHWKEYLECTYGDYMQLPPENERVGHGHSDTAIDFGKYAWIKTLDDLKKEMLK